MKSRPFLITLFLSLTLLVIACRKAENRDGNPRNPEFIADQFLTALQYGDFDEAKTLSSEETREALEFYESTSKFGKNKFDKDFEIDHSEIEGDYAKVYYTQENGDKHRVIKLRRDRSRGWVVIMTKQDLNDDSNIKINFDSDDEDDANHLMDSDGPSAKPAHLRGASGVAWEFLTAMQFGDFDRAKKLGTAETREALDFQTNLLAGRDNPFDLEFEIVREDVKGKYARVYYKQQGSDIEKELKLRKDFDNGWLVIMTKNDWKDADKTNNPSDFFDNLEEQMDKKAEELEKEFEEN